MHIHSEKEYIQGLKKFQNDIQERKAEIASKNLQRLHELINSGQTIREEIAKNYPVVVTLSEYVAYCVAVFDSYHSTTAAGD